MRTSTFHFGPDAIEPIRDVVANELSFHPDEPSSAREASDIELMTEILDATDEWVVADDARAATPAFGRAALMRIRDLLADEVAALDEADEDERRAGSLETLSRELGRLNAHLSATKA